MQQLAERISISDTLVAVDPGLRGCGVAVFTARKLLWARYVAGVQVRARGARVWAGMAQAVARSISGVDWTVGLVEYPQVYRGRAHKVDPADLIELGAVAGGVATVLSLRTARLLSVLPKQWKGQVPKDVHNRRIEAALDPAEVGRVEERRVTLRHNVLDAVGLGLWALGRL